MRNPEEELAPGLLPRLLTLLGPHVENGDEDLSDAEFVYRVKKRFDLEWNRKQALIDPNE